MQEKVRRFLDTHGMACGPEHRYMDMTLSLIHISEPTRH